MEGKNATSQRPSSAIRGPASSASSGKQKAGYALSLQFSISLSTAVQLHLSRQCCCICCLAGSWYTDLGTHCTCTYTSAKTRRTKLVTAGDAVQCGTAPIALVEHVIQQCGTETHGSWQMHTGSIHWWPHCSRASTTKQQPTFAQPRSWPIILLGRLASTVRSTIMSFGFARMPGRCASHV